MAEPGSEASGSGGVAARVRGQEGEAGPAPDRTGLGSWGRAGVGVLGAGLITLVVPHVLAALWLAVQTFFATGEVPVRLPASSEVPYAEARSASVLTGGFSHADFLLQGVDETARLQLTAARLLTAAILGIAVVLLLSVTVPVVLNRADRLRSLHAWWGAAGIAIAAASITSSALTFTALRVIAGDLEAAGIPSIYASRVVFEPDHATLGGALALVLVALLLHGARKSTPDRRR